MKGFLMLLGTGVFTSVLLYGAWYIITHVRVVEDKKDDDKTDDTDVNNTGR